jgi:hypothetical protein
MLLYSSYFLIMLNWKEEEERARETLWKVKLNSTWLMSTLFLKHNLKTEHIFSNL